MQQQINFTIRPIEAEDALEYHTLLTHPQLIPQLHHLPSMEFLETETWLKKEEGNWHRLVAEQNGRILGYTQLTHFANPRLRHSGHVELFVHPDFWRRGIGTALLQATLDIADNWLNLTRIQLAPFTDNDPALALLHKFGFAEEGVRKKVAFGNGRFQDDLVMVRLRNTHIYDQQRSSPAPQRPTGPRPTGAVTLRPVQTGDLKAIYNLFRFPAICRTTLQLPSQEMWRSARRVNAAPAGMIRYVAQVDGKVVGMGSLYQAQNSRAHHCANLGMMVHPHYWGMGIGSKLMAQLMDSADNWLNLQRVELEVNRDNPPAIALYHKFGFVIEGTHQYHSYGDGRMADSYFMANVK